jgi:murein DD-endopeptidase MepM/ murein hydrolase activator NlpD
MKKILILIAFLITIQAQALQLPMKQFVITSQCGYRENPLGGGEESFHRGLDMVGPAGSQILAAADGVVVEHWLPPGTIDSKGVIHFGHPTFGAMIVIDHGNGMWTLYGHMSDTFVHEGMHVKGGQVIGIQGCTGQSTGEHLHFEVVIDPHVLFPNLPVSANQARRLLK